MIHVKGDRNGPFDSFSYFTKFYFSSLVPEEKAKADVIVPEHINEETFVIVKSTGQNETIATEVTETETKLEKSNVSDTSSIGMGKFTPYHPWLEMCWRKELPCLRQNSKETEVCEMTVKYIKFIQEQAG